MLAVEVFGFNKYKPDKGRPSLNYRVECQQLFGFFLKLYERLIKFGCFVAKNSIRKVKVNRYSNHLAL